MPADRDNLERILEAKARLTRKEGDAMRRSTTPKSSYGLSGKGWVPTRKWMAATVVAAGTIGVDWATTGWSQALTIATIGLVVQRATAYLIPNGSDQDVA